MNNNEYSQGPWEWAITDQESQSVDIFEASTARTIARTVLNYPIKTQEANARLISAAPLLLEACVIALDYLKDSSPGVAHPIEGRLEAAIKQATESRG